MVPWACLLAVVLLALMATGSPQSSSPGRQTYIVLMDSTKVAALDRALAGTKRWYEYAIDALVELSAQEEEQEQEQEEEVVDVPQLLYVYEAAISGFAAQLSAKHVKFLGHLHGFLSANPDEILLSLHTTHSTQFLGLKPGEGLWEAHNLASDVVIGVVDTGIWPEHVSFRDNHHHINSNINMPRHWKGTCEAGQKFSPTNCNTKLIGARAFYRGYEATAGRINETREYRSARDSNGHGTHTASTAAGNVVAGASLFGNARGFATGVRYTARIAAYKACWSSGCANSDILAAVDRAVADGVDVLSLSLGGSSRPYFADTLAIAAFGATQKGVFVACSAGNSGPSEYTVSNTAPWITTVAASYLDRSFPTVVKLGDGRTFRGASLYSGKPTRQSPLVYGDGAGPQENGAAYCIPGSLSPRLVRGKIVLCERGLNGRTQKGEQVKLAGGTGMLLLNSDDNGEELFADPHILPASSLGAAASKAVKNYVMSSKRPTVAITFRGTVYGNPAPQMAAFSSRGPSSIGPDIIKPDITAPGMSILAAWPPMVSPSLLKSDKRRVNFNIISGTSMSCPHLSGIAALLKSKHPDWSPAAIKSALMTTAYTLNNHHAPIVDMGSASPATPFAFGSGHVDPERASNPGLVYDITTKDYQDYLCSLNFTSSQRATLARRRYSCRLPPINKQNINGGVLRLLQPGDLNYPSFALLFESGGARNVTATYSRTATNVGAARCRYTANVREPKGVSMTVEPRVLDFVKVGEKLSYRVTFVGLGGSTASSNSFGELVWRCGAYSVRSPVAATWIDT